MGFFDRAKEFIEVEDSQREYICSGLRRLGIDARLAEKGCEEEKVNIRGEGWIRCRIL